MNDWDEFDLRPARFLSAHGRAENVPAGLTDFVAGRAAMLEQPLRGITTDGVIRSGLFSLDDSGRTDTALILEAASALVAMLDADQRTRLSFPIDAEEKRRWLNVHPNMMRHGLLLADLAPNVRQAVLAIIATSLSERGYQQSRDIMRLNGLVADLTGSPDEFGEWPYFFSLFGEPSADGPWGWQLDGHHLNLNCLVFDDRIVMTPSFMGSEPCRVTEGPLADTQVFESEERAGLALIRSLADVALEKAVLRPSIHPDHLPVELQDPIDGRMLAGAFRDNATIAYEGVRGDELTDAQRALLERLVATYVGWGRHDHAEVRMEEVTAHLDETYFAWMGSAVADAPFYYRVQSPVVLIEFDHHPGIVWDNPVPTPNHIHSIMRTPNGGDYGIDLLRQHYERFDHTNGQHRAHGHERQSHD